MAAVAYTATIEEVFCQPFAHEVVFPSVSHALVAIRGELDQL